jgi:hypothetical protein
VCLISKGRRCSPQALNAYGQGNSGPLSFSDPLGLMWGAECGPDGVLCGTGEVMSDPDYVDNRAYFTKRRGCSRQSIDSFRNIAAGGGCKRGLACSREHSRTWWVKWHALADRVPDILERPQTTALECRLRTHARRSEPM